MIRYCDFGAVDLPGGLGPRVWFRFEISEGFTEASVDLVAGDDIVLHVKLVEEGSQLVIGSFYGEWGAEERGAVVLRKNGINVLGIEEGDGAVTVSLNGSSPRTMKLRTPLADVDGLDNRLAFGALVSDGGALGSGWRQCVRPSGKEAPSPVAPASETLLPGITAIVRAKNEERTIGDCIDGVAPFVDRVVSVDNRSSDATYARMRDAQDENFNVEVFRYQTEVPRVGAAHEAAYFSNATNTLGRYYNFCLSKCRTTNFFKWDADFLPIAANLEEMVSRYHLRTRTDNFSLWFSGVSVWTDGERFWIDEEAHYNEFRAHSALHGARWVDLPPWEEMDQSYLFKAQLFAFRKPVFVELFQIDVDEFENRGICEADVRDRRRRDALREYASSGTLPASFTPLASLDDRELLDRPLSSIDAENARYMLDKYDSVPTITMPEAGAEIARVENVRQATFGVFCISHRGNTARQQTIRETTKRDFDELGIPFYFVVGAPGADARIEGDTIVLDCPDTYEFLATKIGALCAFFEEELNLDYMAKIDDDTCINAITFSQLPYYRHDYFGGGIAGGREATFDWHRGKCSNPQLDEFSVIPENGASWYGGGYGYFLSRRAASAIAARRDALRRHLYEDIGVRTVLCEAGLVPETLPKPYASLTFEGAQANMSRVHGSHLITDIPGNEEIRDIHERMKRVSNAHPCTTAVEVDTDWWSVPQQPERSDDHVVPSESADRAELPTAAESSCAPRAA